MAGKICTLSDLSYFHLIRDIRQACRHHYAVLDTTARRTGRRSLPAPRPCRVTRPRSPHLIGKHSHGDPARSAHSKLSTLAQGPEAVIQLRKQGVINLLNDFSASDVFRLNQISAGQIKARSGRTRREAAGSLRATTLELESSDRCSPCAMRPTCCWKPSHRSTLPA